ncbi:MAG: hypothetical protein ACRENJ_11090 [Candidatus Eiseniibacteriota bacterium]
MSLRTMALGAMMVSLPVVVEVPASTDSAGGETRVTLVGGVGRYAIIDRGCEGQVLDTHPARFREVGGSIEHRFSNDLVVGVRGGTVRDTRDFQHTYRDYSTYPYRDSVVVVRSESEMSYVNPFVAVEADRVGAGVGFLSGDPGFRRFRVLRNDFAREPLPLDQMSFHIRLGRLDKAYFRLSHMESLPLWTGGSALDMGFGARPHPRWDFYWGIVGGQPFDGPGVGLGAEYRVLPHWALSARARLGQSGGKGQNAVALGVTYSSRARATSPGTEPVGADVSGRP